MENEKFSELKQKQIRHEYFRNTETLWEAILTKESRFFNFLLYPVFHLSYKLRNKIGGGRQGPPIIFFSALACVVFGKQRPGEESGDPKFKKKKKERNKIEEINILRNLWKNFLVLQLQVLQVSIFIKKNWTIMKSI